ncbi:hypothetical protein FRC03_005313 [Tulasnella sp. 419]|nr:hypothetical protein FRC03_005313 [Tulasnella sp. 419]
MSACLRNRHDEYPLSAEKKLRSPQRSHHASAGLVASKDRSIKLIGVIVEFHYEEGNLEFQTTNIRTEQH